MILLSVASVTEGKLYLMLINLKHDGLQNERSRRNDVDGLLCLGQPVDEVLQRVVEVRGQLQGFLQFHLKTSNIIRVMNVKMLLFQTRVPWLPHHYVSSLSSLLCPG